MHLASGFRDLQEPDDDMIEVGIASVEAVFDWREYLRENFGEEDKNEAL